MSATVGVVIPVHRHERFVAAAVRSVLEQTRPPERLVVVDDGSPDGSLAAAERAVRRHARHGVEVEVRGQANIGAAATLNREFADLGTDILTVLNSDDEWHPERLERLVGLLRPDEPGLVLSDTEFFGSASERDIADYRRHHTRILRLGRNLPSFSTALRIWNLAISTGNLVLTRPLWELVGPFDEELPIAHDWEFLLRVAREVEPVLHPERLFRYRIHGGNTSRNDRDAAAADLQAVLQVQLAQGVADAPNPIAATARNLPTLLPFLVPLWESTLGVGQHPVPRLLGGRAAEVRDTMGPDGPAVPAADQRQLAAGLLRELRTGGGHGGEAGEGATAARAAAERWRTWRQPLASARGRRRPTGEAAGFTWGDRGVTVHSEDASVIRALATLTGVRPAPVATALGRADLNVVGARDVVTRQQLRTFPDEPDRMVWLALTLAEFLCETIAVTLHAAAITVPGGAIVVCGPPHAGKSTSAANAIAAGIDVIGDDQVEIRSVGDDIRVLPVPRPLKLRPRGASPAPEPPAGGVRGHLDGEPVTLLPRPTRHDGDDLPVVAVVHLRRRRAAGFVVEPVGGPSRKELLLPQLRSGTAAEDVVGRLCASPTLEAAVGPDADADALAAILARVRTDPGDRRG